MKTINLKELRNALSCWQDDYDCDDDKEQYDMFGAAIDAVSRLEAAESERDELRLEIARIGGAKAIDVLRRDAAAGGPVDNPVLGYADSYRGMASRGVENVPIWGVITILERFIAPLCTTPPASSVPDRNQLRELVDMVWNEATESETVPSTADADRIIDKVFHGIVQEPASSRYQSAAPAPGGDGG